MENMRNMGFINTGLARLFLECALYLASLTNSQDVSAIVREEQKPIEHEMSEFFYNRVVETIQRIANHLQTSPDEFILFVHFVLRQFLVTQPIKKLYTKSLQLKSKEDRAEIENEFSEFINTRVLGANSTVEGLIGQFTNVLAEEAKNSESDLLFRIAYDLVEPAASDNEEDSDGLEFLNQKTFWQFRKQITLKSFMNSFNAFLQKRTPQQQVEYQLLNKFLQQLDNLKVRHKKLEMK